MVKRKSKSKKKWGSIGAPHSAIRKKHLAKIRRKSRSKSRSKK